MAVRYPFQKLCCVQATEHRGPLLFAASGPALFTFQLSSGRSTSRWSSIDGPDNPSAKTNENPNKRIKLDHEQNVVVTRQDSEESVEISVERRKGERRKPRIDQPRVSNVSHLLATSDGQTLLAVTIEDKTVHVFQISNETGVLKPKSARSMPKRICAIVLDPSEEAIVVGDKFGDVYSLPLHPSDNFARPMPPTNIFEPSATEFTVHTKGNLEALRQQREQKNTNARKEAPEFEHKLLLGHVSLLTDVLIARTQNGEKKRTFILTSDRDEHIRVSRYPQAHVIEGYCLGHRDFISRLCVPRWSPQYLISGGGEPSVKVYKWQTGRVVEQVTFDKDLRAPIQEVLGLSKDERSSEKLAVSGVWAIHSNVVQEGFGIVLVALEGLPLLFSFILDARGHLEHRQIIKLSRNVLDVAQGKDQSLIIVSLDSAHVAGSVKILDTNQANAESLVAFELHVEVLRGLEWRPAKLANSLNEAVNELDKMTDVPQQAVSDRQRSKSDYSSLGEFLYGLENLRKRQGQGVEDAEDGVADDEPAEVMEEP